MRPRGSSAGYKRRRFPSRKHGRCLPLGWCFSAPLRDGVGRAFERAQSVREKGSLNVAHRSWPETRHNLTRLSRSALVTTDIELIAIAAPANIGESSNPERG